MISTTNTISLSTVQQILDYIEDNLTNELTPASISANFYISTSTLSNLFKIVCGMTIMEYIRNRRLTLAAEELSASNIHIIDLALKYGYDTPEAFTKAFSRVHGFPPSFVRRGFPVTKSFLPLQIMVSVKGGWSREELTKADCSEQDPAGSFCYDNFGNSKATINKVIYDKGGKQMSDKQPSCQIDTSTMQYQKEWNILYNLSEELLQKSIPFKVDGKTMIFAHGLEFAMDKICLTFKWKDEEGVRRFFEYKGSVKGQDGFKYFDTFYRGMKVRCMFYGGCPGAETDEFLYRNTELIQVNNIYVPVQTLEFYYENASKDSVYYKMVEEWLIK